MAKKTKTAPKKKHVDNPNVIGLHSEVTEQPITQTLESNYMPYAMSTNVSRAFPEIDGFKPSHRKLLYTMYKMGLLTGARQKSANIVGQTMKLNPHGDSAIYETMVRLATGNEALLAPFVESKGNFGKYYSGDLSYTMKLNPHGDSAIYETMVRLATGNEALLAPFVESKGNFGKYYSGDLSYAASRYTEAKLSPICAEIFKDIDKNPVDFIDSYDGAMKEPRLLPTLSYAASRYTEAKLSPICAEIFKDIDKNPVDFIDSYDGAMKEPRLLPTTFPNILVSANKGIGVAMAEIFKDIDKNPVDFIDSYDGAMKEPRLLPTTFPNILVSANKGIGVAMASDICGFNLNETCTATMHYLEDPDCDLIEYMPAPDFSTGGEIIYRREEMERIFNTGTGSFQIRSRWRYLPDERIIEVYEIPYTTKTDVIIDRIVKLSKEGKVREIADIRDETDLSGPDERIIEVYEIPYTTKTDVIIDRIVKLSKEGKVREIADIRDETDLSGLRIAIDLKRGVDPEQLMAKLFRSTTLQDSFSCNFNVLVDGYPRVMGVREILREWVAWRVDSTRRRLNFDLEKKSDRLHLLHGLEAILLDIDKAISIIRGTKLECDVVPNLMKGFGIDQVQAEFVAEIKLRNINEEYILNLTWRRKAIACICFTAWRPSFSTSTRPSPSFAARSWNATSCPIS